MKLSNVLLFVCTGALALAGSAASYKVTFFMPSEVAGKQFRAGEYKIQINGDKAVIRDSKGTVEAPVKVETGDTKFATTSIRYQNVDGKAKVDQIRVGGTNTTLVFGAAAPAAAGIN
jgi:hypothetical protein